MERLEIITTLQQLEEAKKYVASKDIFAVDTETTGVDKDAIIIGFSFCADTDLAYYVVTHYWDKDKNKLIATECAEHAADFVKLFVGKSLIMHNAVFDCFQIYNNYKIDLMPYVHTDTMILAHLLDENRSAGLKELGVSIFGENAKKEQEEMKASVLANGGALTKANYELYKADYNLIGKYGAKDTLLTLNLFYHLVPQLGEEGLWDFFYFDESMPLLKGPTYDLNTVGLKVDVQKLETLKKSLEVEILELTSFISKEITPIVKDKYPGTNKKNTFNIGSNNQLSWLLFFQLDNRFNTLTKEGRNLCKFLGVKLPYSDKAKREFIIACRENLGKVWDDGKFDPKKGKNMGVKKVGEPWKYLACGKDTLKKLSEKYAWVKKLLELKKAEKLLHTYVIGIQERMKYGVINPSFMQIGTTSGRYSSKNPNFQNLPRDDKRIKSCIISRPGRSFVGADYSQLEPRVFASFSKDERLLKCFSDGLDFYSVIGVEVFNKKDTTLVKSDDDPNFFGNKYKSLRNISKGVALSATYGTTAPKLAPLIGVEIDEAKKVIDDYFEKFPSVELMMLESHEMAKKDGKVVNLFGRPRRMPEAKRISKIYGNSPHSELPYEARNLLNLAVNHRIQSTAASIVNRAAIAFHNMVKEANIDAKIVLQCHDELVVECADQDATAAIEILKYCMENTITLPGVDLIAEPKIAKILSDLK